MVAAYIVTAVVVVVYAVSLFVRVRKEKQRKG
jgi:isoprenylcysteine carboxyl methyltransferase (ICMT) family protein YpbQ